MSTEFFNDQWRIPSNENQNKVSNYSMDFNGSSDKIEVQDSSNEFGFSSNKFSLSAWIRIDSNASQNGVIAKRNIGSATTNKMWYFEINTSSQLRFLWYNTLGSSGNASSTDTIPLNTWTHIVVTSDGSGTNGINFYINGTADSGGSKTGPSSSSSIQQTGTPLWIGARGGNSSAQYTSGKIDQVTIFDYELSPIQVASLGLDGYAFNFSGSNQYINYGNSNDFSFSTNTTNDLPFSFSGWVKPDNTSAFRFIRKAPLNTGAGWEYIITTNSSGLLTFLIYSDASNRIGRRGSTAITSTDWQHWAFTYDGTGKSTGTNSGMKIYINGVEFSSYDDVNSGTYIGMTSGSEPLLSGISWGNSGLTYADGEMSNVSIFNTELSSTQVSTIYNSGKPGNISSLNPVGWWKLDDTSTFNSGTSVWTIPDDSSNSNNGTSNGMNASSLVASNINGELIANPMITNPKPIAYYQLGDQSAYNGSNYLVPNNSLGGYDFKFDANSTYSSGDRIDISGINKALAGATSMSMTFWVYLTPAVYNNGMVFRMDTFPGTIQLRFVRYGNSRGPVWMFSMSDGTNSSGPSGSTSNAARPNFYNSDFLPSPAGSNIWWNITCTWDGSTMKVYRDASTQSGRWGTYAGTIPSSADSKASLGSNTSLSLFMDGRISNVAFWRNYTLTQAEASEVYNNGAPLDLNNFSGSAPAVWYKLNDSEIFNSTSTEWSVDNNAYPSVYTNSLNFDGNTDYIDCGTGSRFNIDQITISSWVKLQDNLTNLHVIGGIRNTNNGLITYMINHHTNGKFRFIINQSSDNAYKVVYANDNTVLNTWYHVVGVADGSNVKLYINGDLQTDQTTYDGTITSPTQNFNIGRQPSNPLYYLDGELSNIAVFDTGLSLSQVETLYNNGTPEASISHSPVSWWKLNNTNTGLIDNGSASNNGTNNGATEYVGFINTLAGESTGMDSSNLVVSDLIKGNTGYTPYTLSLDAANSNLFNCGNNNSLRLTTAITISAWVKYTANSTLNRYSIVSRENSTSTNYRLVLQNNSGTARTVQFISGTSSFLSTGTVARNEWTHVAVAVDGSNINIYINGVSAGSSSSFAINSVDDIDFEISNSNYSNSYFPGAISNVAVWNNTSLSSTEITEVYNQGLPSNLHSFSGNVPTSWWQIGSNSSYDSGTWTCLDEIGTNNAVSAGSMTNNAITNGPGYSASGLGNSSIDIKGDAPYSSANGLSENMDVLDRTTDIPS